MKKLTLDENQKQIEIVDIVGQYFHVHKENYLVLIVVEITIVVCPIEYKRSIAI